MTRRGVLVLGPLAALGFAGWQSRDLVAAETVLKDVVQPVIKEFQNHTVEEDWGKVLKDIKNYTAEEDWGKGNITLFKEKFNEKKKSAKNEIETLRKQVDKRNNDLISDLQKLADKVRRLLPLAACAACCTSGL